MFSVDLLAAGCSSILGEKVVNEGPSYLRNLPIEDLFQVTYAPLPTLRQQKKQIPPQYLAQDSSDKQDEDKSKQHTILRPKRSPKCDLKVEEESVKTDPREEFTIFVKTLTGLCLSVPVDDYTTGVMIKAYIEESQGIPIDQQRMIFSGQVVGDNDVISKLGAGPDSTLHMVLRLRGGGCSWFRLSKKDLAPKFDYDFTDLEDDGIKYMRGKFEYRRPYGWYRYALNVVGRYEDDVWLGSGGYRTATSSGEWPVSYHGTSMKNVESISEEGYSIMKSSRFLYGRGIYSSPHLEVAEQYAQVFEYKGQYFKIVLQNRVNPEDGHLEIVNNGKYWLSPMHDTFKGINDIRPYGILIKKEHQIC